MSEHFCKNCKRSKGDTCTYTGAVHNTGIECPSFGLKEKEVEMFKVGDEVRVVADEERLEELFITRNKLTGVTGIVTTIKGPQLINIQVDFSSDYEGTWWPDAQDLELTEQPTIAGHTARTFVGHPEGAPEVKVDKAIPGTSGSAPIRTFDTGATRDTTQGKLDYVKALSPIVLRRYVQYMHENNLMADGSVRDVGDWKKGQPQEVYHKSKARHFMASWLIEEGYTVMDNHGLVDEEHALCGELFNVIGKLHEVIKVRLVTETD